MPADPRRELLPVGRRWFLVASAKDEAGTPKKVRADDWGALSRYPFWTPNLPEVVWCIVMDIDHPDALARIADAVASGMPEPSWIVETSRGRAQCGWSIDPVLMRADADPDVEERRRRPRALLEATRRSLRIALDGDPAFSGHRCRSPLYSGAQVTWGPTAPRRLHDLWEALKAAGLWRPKPDAAERRTRGTRPPVLTAAAAATSADGPILEGMRNETVFDACRHAAYAGRDFEAAAWQTNARCVPPLPNSEVEEIIASVRGFMERFGDHTPGAATGLPSAVHELAVEMGRRGGQANTPKQRAARRLGTAAAAAVKSAEGHARAVAGWAKAAPLVDAGASMRAAAKKLDVPPSTLKRWRAIASKGVPHPEHQGLRAEPHSPATEPNPETPHSPRPASSPADHLPTATFPVSGMQTLPAVTRGQGHAAPAAALFAAGEAVLPGDPSPPPV